MGAGSGGLGGAFGNPERGISLSEGMGAAIGGKGEAGKKGISLEGMLKSTLLQRKVFPYKLKEIRAAVRGGGGICAVLSRLGQCRRKGVDRQ